MLCIHQCVATLSENVLIHLCPPWEASMRAERGFNCPKAFLWKTKQQNTPREPNETPSSTITSHIPQNCNYSPLQLFTEGVTPHHCCPLTCYTTASADLCFACRYLLPTAMHNLFLELLSPQKPKLNISCRSSPGEIRRNKSLMWSSLGGKTMTSSGCFLLKCPLTKACCLWFHSAC